MVLFVSILCVLLLFLFLGALYGWWSSNGKLQRLQAAKQELGLLYERSRSRCEELEKSAEDKVRLLSTTQERLEKSLDALCYKALQKNSEQFMQQAQSVLQGVRREVRGDLDSSQATLHKELSPIREILKNFDGRVDELEKQRNQAFGALEQQLKAMVSAEGALRRETQQLVQALRTPHVRGSWGELQLKKVVEISGMAEHCDFSRQQSIDTEEGRIRPDLFIHLPGNKLAIVDAKAPMEAYLQAMTVDDAGQQEEMLKRHARHVRGHIEALGRKNYFASLPEAPEFVVLFLPGESFFSAALQYEPSLVEYGVGKGILLATPTTLVAMLRSIAYGWKQEKISAHAAHISATGHELYKRLSDLGQTWGKLGKQLATTVKTYNQVTGTLSSRVMPSARRFESLHVGDASVDMGDPLELAIKPLTAPELRESPPA